MDYRHLLAVTLVTPALLLTGCHASTPTADPPRVAPSATSPTPARETPQHFIRRFVAVTNAMEEGGAARRFRTMAPRCTPCRELVGQIRQARRHGGFYRSRGWALRHLRMIESAKTLVFDLRVWSWPTAYRMSSRASVQHYTGGALHFRVGMRSVPAGWQITDIAQVAS